MTLSTIVFMVDIVNLIVRKFKLGDSNDDANNHRQTQSLPYHYRRSEHQGRS
ncbi:hypothetical protein VCRA2114E365_80028 [Vibrio crassostreae]|nr:hypothetical protein VCRA2113O218_290021 [Vibrio crassostreae]CAK2010447.1 hypothetical protein VCRA2113O120_320028 [Vibrio crassostreae]CAK2016280.1 hypothetical protein VCRA2118O239_300029 [Vibrio crassostreae]CAK2034068.1 hypothetical protein VCRA2112O192_300021 [Vibrio crassostreae]CAK2034275.1 hypothetical protein VCRA2112E186_300029 [Vibrio crassostreae]